MWHRAVASYLRAAAAVLGTVTLSTDFGVWKSIGLSLLGALLPPVIVFITESADLLSEG
jgi:hypothetical protein